MSTIVMKCTFCYQINLSRPRDDDPPAPDSPLVKLLKSGRVPEARQGTILDMIGKRGHRCRPRVSLSACALSRTGSRPRSESRHSMPWPKPRRRETCGRAGKSTSWSRFFGRHPTGSDPALEKALIRLAGLWKIERGGRDLARHRPVADGRG